MLPTQELMLGIFLAMYKKKLRSNLRSDKWILSGGAKARNYHAQISMLKSLQCVQSGEDMRLQNIEIYLFGKVVQVELLCPIFLFSTILHSSL